MSSKDILPLSHEFFSWKGFIVGAFAVTVVLLVQAMLGFPQIFQEAPVNFFVHILFSAMVVGTTSGAVLVYLIPPDQDVIGIAGFGSDSISQHLALFLVIFALILPEFLGFIFFYTYFAVDPFAPIWVLVGFAAPSLGLAVSMFHRIKVIADELREYFKYHDQLDLVSLPWIYEFGPRTAVYRMGMLENAAARVRGLRVRGHYIVREKDPFPVSE